MRLGGTPVPIPNTMVKTQAADGTARQRGRAGGRQIKKRKFIRDPSAWKNRVVGWLMNSQIRAYLENRIYETNPADSLLFKIRRGTARRDRKTSSNKESKKSFKKLQREQPFPTLWEGWTVKQKGRRADALALGADERRDKLRKASGRGKYPAIRRCLNGETHMGSTHVPIRQSITYGREPGELKHLSTQRKRKKTRPPE